MNYLIIIKWLPNWDDDTSVAPSIISTMIGMFLRFGEVPHGAVPLVPNQTLYCNLLLVVALIAVPTMLFVKPLYLKKELDKKTAQKMAKEKHYQALSAEDREMR